MKKSKLKEILPLGSIVKLKGSNLKKIMICARIQEDRKTGTIYDYAACYYPEGIINASELFLFQHDNIDCIFYVGMQDSEEFAFHTFMENKLTALDLFEK
ncbi:MAG: DUF4176 domain-containing protein [Bacilli bacterium]